MTSISTFVLTTSVFFFFQNGWNHKQGWRESFQLTKINSTSSLPVLSLSHFEQFSKRLRDFAKLWYFGTLKFLTGAKSWSHCPLILNSLFCKCHPTFKVMFHHIFTLHKTFLFWHPHIEKWKKFKPSVIEQHHHHHHPHLLALSQTDHRINALKCFSDYWINWPTNCPWRS